MESTSLLRLHGVTKRHGSGEAVLRGIDLTIDSGQVTGILGANGAGKSTLLRVLAGLSRPSGGTITGHPATAYVPDRFPARQRMSARAYLCHMGRVRGMRSADARARAEYWLVRFDLAGGPSTPLRELSKGNAQKVGIAQALLSRPDLLVLDEPWSGLDVAARGILTDVIDEIRAEGTAVVFTDHRPALVRSLSTTAHKLVGGRLLSLGGAEPTTRIVLTGGPATDWSTRDGVVESHADDQETVLTVRVSEREPVLLAAIRGGWSVLAVEQAR
ncbi:ABC transporter ATP-binding protein [Saccharopolyspora taberi]|uniref:ABC transporter ATP-binding protein n=1 Tax=Saccharopolyspora taberi TaxID=60895 RepID=A0ABN3VMV0_9PSEU